MAVGKPATQSSTDTVNSIVTDASRAVDGNIDGNISAGSVSQTLPEIRPWWEIDLGAPYLINTVEVYHRTDCCINEFKEYYVLVSAVPFDSHDLDDTLNQPEVISFRTTSLFEELTKTTMEGAGRYVRIQLLGNSQKTLRLAEVRVLGVPLPTAPATAGQWERIPDLPDIPVHISLLPSRKLLFWGRDKRPDGFDTELRSNVYLWEPVSNTFTRKDNERTNLFCSGHSFLPNGDLFVAGGAETPTENSVKRYDVEGHGPRATNIFDYEREEWLPGPDMNLPRWYPSVITLSSGETLIVTGDYVSGFTEQHVPVRQRNRDTEILALNRTLPRMPNGMPGDLTNYPFLHLGPGGNVLVISRTAPSAAVSDDDRNGLYYDLFDREWVDLPNLDLRQHHDMATSVMYDKGKVMVIGGKRTFTQVSKDTEVIDLNQNSWTQSTWAPAAPMNFPRYFHTSVLMPDGQVFVVGGSNCGGANNIRTQDGGCTGGAIMNPEIYNPALSTGQKLTKSNEVRAFSQTALIA